MRSGQEESYLGRKASGRGWAVSLCKGLGIPHPQTVGKEGLASRRNVTTHTIRSSPMLTVVGVKKLWVWEALVNVSHWHGYSHNKDPRTSTQRGMAQPVLTLGVRLREKWQSPPWHNKFQCCQGVQKMSTVVLPIPRCSGPDDGSATEAWGLLSYLDELTLSSYSSCVL